MARILITDDEPVVRKVLSAMLSGMGYDVETAFGGPEAVRLFAERPFDLVITDMNMPVMNGCMLAKRIKNISSETPVIMITGDPSVAEFQPTEHKYVDLIISKPVTMKTLEKAMTKYVRPLLRFKKAT